MWEECKQQFIHYYHDQQWAEFIFGAIVLFQQTGISYYFLNYGGGLTKKCKDLIQRKSNRKLKISNADVRSSAETGNSVNTHEEKSYSPQESKKSGGSSL